MTSSQKAGIHQLTTPRRLTSLGDKDVGPELSGQVCVARVQHSIGGGAAQYNGSSLRGNWGTPEIAHALVSLLAYTAWKEEAAF